MSLFLGKIHYWLFNKILWFENLEEEIINLAKEKGLDIDTLRKEIEEKYEAKLDKKPLEDMIDTNNIHGWLQGKINSAENRMASWTYEIIESDNNNFDKIKEIYITQGIKAAKEVKSENKKIFTAKDIYNYMNDYILDGMPCDRVNEVIESTDELITFRRRMCVHKNIWKNNNLDVKYFYDLRNEWIRAFVSELNDNFEFVDKEELKIIKLK